jgi:hypothetical protein
MRGMIRTLALGAVLAAGTATVATAQGVNNTGYSRDWYNGYPQYPAPNTETNLATPPNYTSPPQYVLQGGYVDGGKWRSQWVLEPSGVGGH